MNVSGCGGDVVGDVVGREKASRVLDIAWPRRRDCCELPAKKLTSQFMVARDPANEELLFKV